MALVTSEPGARMAWHTHPLGQTLIVTTGAGRVQREGGPRVDFLQTQAFVDPDRIGGIGICGSGSFILSAAKIDPRLKAIATASMYDMGR